MKQSMATLLTSFFSGVFDVARNELQAGRFIEELEKGIALAKIIGWRWKPEDRDAIEKKISGMIRSMRRRFTNIQSLVLKENFDELMVDWTSLKEKLEGITTPSTKDVADVYKERERRKHLNVVKEEITGGSVDPVMNEVTSHLSCDLAIGVLTYPITVVIILPCGLCISGRSTSGRSEDRGRIL